MLQSFQKPKMAMTTERAVFKRVMGSTPDRNVSKKCLSHCKRNYAMRYESAEALCDITYFAIVDLAAVAWPKAFEMSEKVIWHV